ncbi:hypothetical protein RRG08_055344 [Elysia crispata]|uniref:Uncharacterized protein n=1 Tax=Elysia crispata TaxID=231223 RepID=A0AAE1E2Z1_9GAST|nr:hypothetical protein RRG08_055344 [Elysia crispata]
MPTPEFLQQSVGHISGQRAETCVKTAAAAAVVQRLLVPARAILVKSLDWSNGHWFHSVVYWPCYADPLIALKKFTDQRAWTRLTQALQAHNVNRWRIHCESHRDTDCS